MLVEFSVKNFLSFKDLAKFSMVASTHKQHIDTHVFNVMDYTLLKTSAIYGANASGKSNLFNAMKFATNFIITSSKDTQSNEEIQTIPFLLNLESEKEPSLFEFIFIQGGFKYRYGFKANQDKVFDEWLFCTTKQKETKLFERNFQTIKVSNSFIEGHYLESKTRKNALFLSVVAQFNGEIAESILKWFYNFNLIKGMNEFTPITIANLKNKEFKKRFTEILKIADLAIEDFRIEKVEVKIPDYIQDILEKNLDKGEKLTNILTSEIKTSHNKYNNANEHIGTVEFDLKENESDGTKKLFSLLGPILDTLNNGRLLFVDELEVKLHPLITKLIVTMFNSKIYNPKNAQLIFSTHDTNLLSNEIFRRDQVWFTEKDKYGATDLYSLIEYKIRPDRSFSKDYLAGKYGAIPFIGDFDFDNEEVC